jgi:hypothetical protein
VRAAMARGAAQFYAISGTERSGAFAGYMQRLYRDALRVMSQLKAEARCSGVGNIASWIGEGSRS